ncbi:unnamed protein product [marine sediment metagenome]|uniref:Uncharacterized protein n=1 Tax=marine sediment metagenome TaxID=412755 RepID=X1CML3_9ZZZZ
MAEMIYKTFRVEVNSVDEESGIIDMLIPFSTPSIDRDGEVLEATMFKKSLPPNPFSATLRVLNSPICFRKSR